jgi:hypothetical protein
VVVLEVLGVGLWAVLGLAGAWWLVTGRKMRYGLPKGMKEGWPMRVMGLVYVLLAGYLIYQAFHGSFYAGGVILAYFFLGLALVVFLNGRRKARRV